MVEALRNTITALKSFNYEREVTVIVEENKDKLADLQAEQLAKGTDSSGKNIEPPYAPFTIQQKKQKSGLAGEYRFVTFYNTGELYHSLKAIVNNKTFTITSDNYKFGKMIRRSGAATAGLNEASKEAFAENVTLPNFRRVFKAKTGLDIG